MIYAGEGQELSLTPGSWLVRAVVWFSHPSPQLSGTTEVPVDFLLGLPSPLPPVMVAQELLISAKAGVATPTPWPGSLPGAPI